MIKIILIIIFLFQVTYCYSEEFECFDKSYDESSIFSECDLWRMKVPNGWIISNGYYKSTKHYAMVFVPDEKHEWKIEDERNKV